MISRINTVFSVLLPIVLFSMALSYLRDGGLSTYNYGMWIVIELVAGIARLAIQIIIQNRSK